MDRWTHCVKVVRGICHATAQPLRAASVIVRGRRQVATVLDLVIQRRQCRVVLAAARQRLDALPVIHGDNLGEPGAAVLDDALEDLHSGARGSKQRVACRQTSAWGGDLR